jgi:hypothetical protein
MAAQIDSEGWEQWLITQLDNLGLDVEVFQGYVEGILDDDSEPIEDRGEAVVQILSGALEDEQVLELTFTQELCSRWQQHKSADYEEKQALQNEKAEAMKAEVMSAS